MWIIPRPITSAYAPGTEALISDYGELSQVCARSLTVRSKHSSLRTWSQKWKRDSWTRLLFGRILRLSHSESFTDWWISSLEVILVNRGQQPENEKAKTIQGTSGPGSQMELEFASQDSVSSRTSKDTSRWDSPQSSATWKSWVTRCRGEYSVRLKLAPRTKESVSSSSQPRMFWPTPTARDWKDSPGMSIVSKNPDGSTRNRTDLLPRAVYALGRQAQANVNSCGSLTEQQNSMRLNPRWVETLMGLPVGWVMPSCSSPVTTKLTN